MSKQLTTTQTNKEDDLRAIIDKYNHRTTKLHIHFELISNENNEKTELSSKLTKELANRFQFQLANKNGITNFDTYATSFEEIKEKIKNTKEYDFILSAQYLIVGDIFKIHNIKLIHKKGDVVSLDNISYTNKSVSALNKLDTPIKVSSVFVEFINMERSDNDIVDSIYLYLDEKKLEKRYIPDLGSVYKTEYNKEYSLSIELNQDAFVYLFLYSPNDPTWSQSLFSFYPFYEGEKQKQKQGKLSLCENCLVFSKTTMGEEIVYLKLIVSKTKIPISDFFKYKKEGNIEVNIAEEKDSEKLYTFIKNYIGKIETQNIILQF